MDEMHAPRDRRVTACVAGSVLVLLGLQLSGWSGRRQSGDPSAHPVVCSTGADAACFFDVDDAWREQPHSRAPAPPPSSFGSRLSIQRVEDIAVRVAHWNPGVDVGTAMIHAGQVPPPSSPLRLSDAATQGIGGEYVVCVALRVRDSKSPTAGEKEAQAADASELVVVEHALLCTLWPSAEATGEPGKSVVAVTATLLQPPSGNWHDTQRVQLLYACRETHGGVTVYSLVWEWEPRGLLLEVVEHRSVLVRVVHIGQLSILGAAQQRTFRASWLVLLHPSGESPRRDSGAQDDMCAFLVERVRVTSLLGDEEVLRVTELRCSALLAGHDSMAHSQPSGCGGDGVHVFGAVVSSSGDSGLRSSPLRGSDGDTADASFLLLFADSARRRVELLFQSSASTLQPPADRDEPTTPVPRQNAVRHEVSPPGGAHPPPAALSVIESGPTLVLESCTIRPAADDGFGELIFSLWGTWRPPRYDSAAAVDQAPCAHEVLNGALHLRPDLSGFELWAPPTRHVEVRCVPPSPRKCIRQARCGNCAEATDDHRGGRSADAEGLPRVCSNVAGSSGTPATAASATLGERGRLWFCGSCVGPGPHLAGIAMPQPHSRGTQSVTVARRLRPQRQVTGGHWQSATVPFLRTCDDYHWHNRSVAGAALQWRTPPVVWADVEVLCPAMGSTVSEVMISFVTVWAVLWVALTTLT